MKKLVLGFLVIAIAAVSFWAGGRYVGDRAASPAGQQGARKVLYYTDPMNPGFRSDKPGTAPCGMPLEPVYADAGGGEDDVDRRTPGTIRISPERQQLIGVRTTAVEKAPMTYNLRLYGKVVPDETKVFRINASTDSWVRKLSDVTTGSIVSKNQVLAETLAPAYYNAQQTYLIALDNVDRIRQQLGGELRHQQGDLADNQIRMAVQAMQNLGITDAQVEELANSRKARPYLQVRAPSRGVVLSRNLTLSQWFKAGDEFYSIADIGRVWVYADVYENESRYLRPGMKVKVRHAQLGKTFAARVSQVLPLFDPLSKTLKVRLDVDNPRYELRPDMFVDVEISITLPPSLHVPADAVIDSGTQTIVYVETGSGIFEPCRVDTGWRLGRRVEIAGGLAPGDRVVVSGNFLMDSESRMKTAGTDTMPMAAGVRTTVPAGGADGDGAASLDPVCRMYVNEKDAESSGRAAKVDGKNYYFCTRECKESFVKKPGKYLGRIPPPLAGHEQAPVPGKARSMSGQGIASPGKKTLKAAQGTGQGSGTAGAVEAGGPDPKGKGSPPGKWRGWGKFPGAEYLGLKERKKIGTSVRQEMPVAGEAPDEGEGQRND